MIPATKTDPNSRSTSVPGPANAPRAPASFQSPAPRLRSRTNGNSSAKPSPRPAGKPSIRPSRSVRRWPRRLPRIPAPSASSGCAGCAIRPRGDRGQKHSACENGRLQMRLRRGRRATVQRPFIPIILKKSHFVTVQKSPAGKDGATPDAFRIRPAKAASCADFHTAGSQVNESAAIKPSPS